MAGDWIKFEHSTSDKPEVVRMAAILKIDQDSVVGKLLRVWVWADLNSLNGDNVGVTESFIDRMTCKRGFAAAMRSVGWLSGTDGSLIFSNFGRHNGKTAKARSETNRRVKDHRQRGESETKSDAECNKKSVTEPLQKPLPEKRREDSNTIAPAAKPAVRERDVLFDALAIAEGSDPKQLTKSAGGRIGQALAQIKVVAPDLQPSDIQDRAKAYRRLYPTAACTAPALAAHWAKLGGSTASQQPAETEPDDWRAYWRETYPPENYPNAERYEEGGWWDIPAATRQQIRDGLRRWRKGAA